MKQNQKKAATGWKLSLEYSFIGSAMASPSRIALADLAEHRLEDGVAGRFAGDVEGLENRHAARRSACPGSAMVRAMMFFSIRLPKIGTLRRTGPSPCGRA